MADHTYRVTDIVGTSPDGIETAIRNALQRAGRTVRRPYGTCTGLRSPRSAASFRPARSHYQVRMKVGFRLEDD